MTTPDAPQPPLIGPMQLAQVTLALPPWLAPEVAAWVDTEQGRGQRFATPTDAARAALEGMRRTRYLRNLT